MDCVFTDEECCIKCQNSLNLLNMWYYLDDFGNQQGPFDSFFILYYIYSGYFDEGSVFFSHDKSNGGPSNYNTLNNYLDKIIEDVNDQAENIFPCTHFMEYLSSSKDDQSVSEDVQMPDGLYNLRGSKEMLIPGENIYESALSNPSSKEFERNPQSSDETTDDPSVMSSANILKKRIINNLKEADAHLNRVNSRRVSTMLERNLYKEPL
ncbi:uncharacterized protein TOT_040000209 [Theileria orientalis strain Shintoku]|uniref:GYF domain-containing protein n=1 Tax=Theileria orientalis strain Shintoku TaxID=869250 RepID=J4DQ48_THEOR|nr:uncharacterized protein TOT_040000209 [Theileria orientalis strain Shintoku]PVC52724.1 hypothetical protein MACL_00000556 [Theileria orientalis]BAM41829.1 uncharacterized protein TOT_040000209 [Theileria orientalis strain Shintoku]|eukprot:XP_009692130.1 uncharacterized protein TOT_040000209 [Theileria orientalis strain Shintoku]